MSNLRAVIVADDLSGANDTGHQFAARGYETTVFTDTFGPPRDAAVAVANTHSRYLPPEAAAERVREAIERYPAPVVYKKIDSTLRGNLVAEIDGMLSAVDTSLAVVAPAFPAHDRVTVGGIHLVEDTPVARTDAGRDPDKPVTDSHVPTLLSANAFDVVHVTIEDVVRGTETVRKRLATASEGAGRTVAVCDAITGDHLESVAVAAGSLPQRPAYVGSGGLASHVRLPSPSPDGVLGIAGSANPVTFEQLSALNAAEVVEIDGERAVERPESAVSDATERATAVIEKEGRVVVTAARSATDVESTVEAGAMAGLSAAETRDRIEDVLAATADAVRRERTLGGLFLTGGNVAKTVLEELRAERIRLTGHSVSDGVPVGLIEGGPVSGTPLVTKAGAFGTEDTFISSLDRLSKYDDER